jgi:hypothetical protein
VGPPEDTRLDELYRESPEKFVAARDALAKELRAAGEQEAATRIGKLRRPSAAASLINRVALGSSELVAEFGEASRGVAEAQERALEGETGAPEEWRAAAARERDSIEAVSAAAAELARDSGRPVSKPTLELVAETLRAAASDPELRDRVLRGRLEREQHAATLGLDRVAAAVGPRRARVGRKHENDHARRELKRLEQELADASEREQRLRARVSATESVLRREKAKLGEAKRATSALRRKLKAAAR